MLDHNEVELSVVLPQSMVCWIINMVLQQPSVLNFWDDNSAYIRSVMLCGCIVTYHFVDGLILFFSM
jgi:hypothetical protein